MNELYLIRHGATAGNLARRYIGRSDEGLCDEGVRQVLALRGRLEAPDMVFSSPMLRARQTAELLFPDLAYGVLDGLRETDFGDFEGKNAAELADDAAYRAWVVSGCAAPIPGGDDPAAFKSRCIAAFLAAMDLVPPGCRAAFILHGGGIMAILEALAIPRRTFYDWHTDNGAVLRCRWDGKALRNCEGLAPDNGGGPL